MYIGLLFLLLHSWHPSGKHKNIEFTLAIQEESATGRKDVSYISLPFYIDIAHVFSSDTGFIQNYICCVPNDGSQEVSVLENIATLTLTFYSYMRHDKRQISFLRCVLLLGSAWFNNARRPWQTEVFGENVNPHLNLSLRLKEETGHLNKDVRKCTLRR